MPGQMQSKFGPNPEPPWPGKKGHSFVRSLILKGTPSKEKAVLLRGASCVLGSMRGVVTKSDSPLAPNSTAWSLFGYDMYQNWGIPKMRCSFDFPEQGVPSKANINAHTHTHTHLTKLNHESYFQIFG